MIVRLDNARLAPVPGLENKAKKRAGARQRGLGSEKDQAAGPGGYATRSTTSGGGMGRLGARR